MLENSYGGEMVEAIKTADNYSLSFLAAGSASLGQINVFDFLYSVILNYGLILSKL